MLVGRLTCVCGAVGPPLVTLYQFTVQYVANWC